MLARLIALIHLAVLIFVLTAWALPWAEVLIAHVIFVPLMVLHWKTNENRCFLTELENRFKETPETALASSPRASAMASSMTSLGANTQSDPELEGYFIKTVWSKVFGEVPSEETLERIVYGALMLTWMLSGPRYLIVTRVF